jgi:hypothetical protein
MPKSSLSYPKVCKHKDGRYYVNFNLNSKRYRLFNGKRIHSSLSPNSYPSKLRRNKAILLAKEVYDYLVSNNYSFCVGFLCFNKSACFRIKRTNLYEYRCGISETQYNSLRLTINIRKFETNQFINT